MVVNELVVDKVIEQELVASYMCNLQVLLYK